jgi:bacterioferritin (cytochrome b1)
MIRAVAGLAPGKYVRSRRDFLRVAGAVTAPGALLAACGGGGGGGGTGATQPNLGEIDTEILNRILSLELAAIAAYSTGAPLLRGRALTRARQFLEQEHEHAGTLSRAIRDLGGTPNEPSTAEEYRREFPLLRNQADVLRFAVDLENRVVRGYVEGLPKLSSPELRQTAAGILTVDAQHISVLLGEEGRQQVPLAFVTGT